MFVNNPCENRRLLHNANRLGKKFEGNGIFESSRIIIPEHKEAYLKLMKNRRVPPKYDRDIYKERHLVECFFNRVKYYRRIALRFEKLACTFQDFLTLASIMIWLT